MRKLYLILLLGMILPSLSAVVCTDTYSTSNNPIQLCGYCSEANGSVCLAARECNISLYYSNHTNILYKQNATNNGDGSITYNMTQNLSAGVYFGILDCGARSYDDFTITLSDPSSGSSPLSVSSGGWLWTRDVDLDEEIKEILEEYQGDRTNLIANDINTYFEFAAHRVAPNNINLGKFLIAALLFLFLFWKELTQSIKKIKIKKKW